MADISNLFMTSPEDDILEYRERRKIDSMTLGESEYDTLLEEHFMSDDASLDGTLKYHLYLRKILSVHILFHYLKKNYLALWCP